MGTEANDGYTSWIFGSVLMRFVFEDNQQDHCPEHTRRSQA